MKPGVPTTRTSKVDWRRFMAHVGVAISEERRSRGWTQAQLAQRAGLHRGAIARVEQGSGVPLRVLWLVARAFGLRAGALLP